MFWAKKPTRKSPYAESRDGNYRIALSFHKRDTPEEVIKYTPFYRNQQIGQPSTDPKQAKRICLSHSRGAGAEYGPKHTE